MRLARSLGLLLTAVLLPTACLEPFSARAEIEVVVMEARVPCSGFLGQDQTCLLVLWEGKRSTEAFYGDIEGFEFQPGFRQRLLVERLTLNNPPADASSYRYRLLRTIAREEVSGPSATSDEPQLAP
jgi:hypothetical protein